jgi:DNA-binding MarR family transcriptional regulator
MAAFRPSDVRLLEWTDRADFGRVRAKWLQYQRWDTALSPSTMVVLAEIAGRMSFDKDFAWPSIRRLAAELGWSEPTVKRAIAQAIERGWLISERRGFSGSNHYAMAASGKIAAAVEAAHEERVALVVEKRATPLRAEMISMEKAVNEISPDLSNGSVMTRYSAQTRSLDEINPGPLTLSINPTMNRDHRSYAERLGAETPSEAAFSDGLADEAQLHHHLQLALGRGDVAVGRRYAEILGSHRVEWLLEQVRSNGVDGASDELRSAADSARDLEAAMQHEWPMSLRSFGDQAVEQAAPSEKVIDLGNTAQNVAARRTECKPF